MPANSSLPTLPAIGSSLLPTGGGGGLNTNIPGGGSAPGSGGGGGLTVNLPSGQSAAFAQTAAALAAEGCSWYDIICLGKSQLLRLVLLLIGLMCIAGAIYLYKPTQQYVVKPALKAGKTVLEGAVEA